VSDFENLDYYELLGVSRSASLDEIKRAYRREISKYHPDRFVNATPEEQAYAGQRSQRLTAAYGVLSNLAARSAYNRGQPPVVGRRAQRPPAPAQARDHQAELYDQAQAHLAAGRTMQAIGALRQLQQINPFYRDSADLLAVAEAELGSRQARSSRRGGRPLLIAGGVAGGVAVAALAAWAIGLRGGATASGTPKTVAPAAFVATNVPTQAPEPSFATGIPTLQPTAAPQPNTAQPTEAPTTAPTETPIIDPTLAPTEALPTEAPTEAPAQAGEPGELLLADAFSAGGWADLSGPGWTVGYQGSRYHITADPGTGSIWSYRTAPARDVSIGVDVQVTKGEGGLLLRFLDANNYVSISLNPSRTSFRLEQHSAGNVNVLDGGQSEAIQTGADVTNRLVARLRGSRIQVLANGQPLADVDAPNAPNTARYGLVAIGGDTASEVFFDNLEIRAVEN
jgi:hypothetical protein